MINDHFVMLILIKTDDDNDDATVNADKAMNK